MAIECHDLVDSNFLLWHRASLWGAIARNSSTVFFLSTYSPRIESDTGRRKIYCWMSIHEAGVVPHIASSTQAHFSLVSITSGQQQERKQLTGHLCSSWWVHVSPRVPSLSLEQRPNVPLLSPTRESPPGFNT